MSTEPLYGSFDTDSGLCYYDGIQGIPSCMSSVGGAVGLIDFEEGVGDLARSFPDQKRHTYPHEYDFS